MKSVGKVIGQDIYVHRSALEFSTLPLEFVQARAQLLPPGWDYQIVRWNRRKGDVSFIACPTWDEEPEPEVGDSYKIGPDGEVRFRAANRKNPQIYHHKHLFVTPDYPGFDVEASQERSLRWESLKPDRTRIGYKSYWEAQVLPLLEATDAPLANLPSHG